MHMHKGAYISVPAYMQTHTWKKRHARASLWSLKDGVSREQTPSDSLLFTPHCKARTQNFQSQQCSFCGVKWYKPRARGMKKVNPSRRGTKTRATNSSGALFSFVLLSTFQIRKNWSLITEPQSRRTYSALHTIVLYCIHSHPMAQPSSSQPMFSLSL